MILNLSASPYRAGYGRGRERMLVQRAIDYLAAVVFVNTVGGQDELVFDGHSLAIDQDGGVIARCAQFEEQLAVCSIDPRQVSAARLRDTRHRVNVRRQRRAAPRGRAAGAHAGQACMPPGTRTRWRARSAELLDPEAEVYAALRTGCVTTCARTASSTWCWRSPAASTPP